MPDHQFDEFFRNKLQGHSSPVPEDMWQRIQEKKKDRKFFFFWLWYFIAQGSLLICLAGGYFISRPARPPYHDTNTLPKSSIQIPLKIPGSPEATSLPGMPHFSAIDRRHNPGSKAHQPNQVAGTQSNQVAGTYQSNQIANAHPPALPHRFMPVALSVLPDPPDTLYDPALTQALKKAPFRYPASKETTAPPSKKDSVGPKHKKWFLDVYASPDWPFNKFNPVDSPRFKKRMELSYTVGLKITWTFNARFSGIIGFQYSEINEKLGLPDSIAIHYDRFKAKSLDIPLLLGYSLGNDRQMAVVHAGVLINAYSWYEFDDMPLPGLFKQHTGLSAYLGLSLVKRVNDKILLFSEPYFKYHLSDMGKYQPLFTQRINVGGLSVGVRYKLSKRQP